MDEPEIFQDPLSFDHACELEGLSNEIRAQRDTFDGLRLAGQSQPASRELERKQRWTEVGRLTPRVAHELRENLAPVTLYLKLLVRRVSDDQGSVDILKKIMPAIATIEATLGDLIQLASDRDPKPQWVNVRGVIEDVYQSISGQIDSQGVETTTDVPRHLGILVDGGLFRAAVSNLVLNALDAMPDGGRLVVTSYTGRGNFELEVADSGPGLSAEARQRMFEPLYSTKNGGAGLGLTVVERVAQLHGGNVVAMNCPEGGAAFTLRFPQRASQAAA